MKKKSIKIIVGIFLLGIGVFIVGSKFLKDGDVKNIFDEIYYSGAPRSLNYYLTTSASMMGTRCIRYREEEHIADFAGSITEDFKESCLWDNTTAIRVNYFKKRSMLAFTVIFSPTDSESKSKIFFFTYHADDKNLLIDYRHNYFDKSKQIETYDTHKLPDSYYEKHGLTRDLLIEEANNILYQHLMPIYFDKNKENGNRSRFSIKALGEFTVDYHF